VCIVTVCSNVITLLLTGKETSTFDGSGGRFGGGGGGGLILNL
jgi:hypothetical protein